MDDLWKELVRSVPWGVVIIALRWLDIREKTEERRERDANAKDKAEQDRQAQIAISSTYASAINSMNQVIQVKIESIDRTIQDFKSTVSDQYRRMGVTQELMETRMGDPKERKRSGDD